MKVDFLTPETGWFSDVANRLGEEVRRKGHECRIVHRHEDLERGELLYILSYLRIVPPHVLDLHEQNIVIHGSDLPSGRGFSPLSWQILENPEEVVFTLFEAAEAVDAGDYYMKRSLPLDGTELFHEWRAKGGALIAEMALEFLERRTALPRIAQEGEGTHYRRRSEADDEVLPDESLAQIFDKLRACDPDSYPVWFTHRGRRYFLRLDPGE